MIVVPVIFATSMGVFFGLIRLARINTATTGSASSLVFGLVACIFFSALLFNLLEMFVDPLQVP